MKRRTFLKATCLTVVSPMTLVNACAEPNITSIEVWDPVFPRYPIRSMSYGMDYWLEIHMRDPRFVKMCDLLRDKLPRLIVALREGSR